MFFVWTFRTRRCCDSALQQTNKKIVSRAGGLKSEKLQTEATLLTSYIIDLKLQQTVR